MDERGRRQLLLKLKNKENSLELDLTALRKRKPDPKWMETHLYPWDYALCGEFDFVALYLEEFSRFSFETAKAISSERWAFELALAHNEMMLERFRSFLAIRSPPPRGKKRQALIEVSIERVSRAISNVEALIAEAEFDFQPDLTEAEFDFESDLTIQTSRPKLDDIDDWIRRCGTQNSKIGWKLISKQTEFPRPLHKIFIERWKSVNGNRKPGRPKKLSSSNDRNGD